MVRYVLKEKEEREKEKELKVYLKKDGENINLMVDDEQGEYWYVASLTPEGKMKLYYHIPDDIGLQVDEKGRIKVEDECGTPFKEENTSPTIPFEINGKTVYFQLKVVGDCLRLVLTDKEGNALEAPNVLAITSDGRFFRYYGVNKRVGLRLDEEGRIIEEH